MRKLLIGLAGAALASTMTFAYAQDKKRSTSPSPFRRQIMAGQAASSIMPNGPPSFLKLLIRA